MQASTPRLVRLWASLVAGTTALAAVGGALAYFVTGEIGVSLALLALPWLATAVLGCVLGPPWLRRFLRAYGWVALGAAAVGFLGTSEGLLDRLTFAGIGLVSPPLVLLVVTQPSFLHHGPQGMALIVDGAVAASVLMFGGLLLLPGVTLMRRWTRFAAVSDLVWIAWLASFLVAAGVLSFVEYRNALLLLPVVALVLLVGLWAPIHLAREAAWVPDADAA